MLSFAAKLIRKWYVSLAAIVGLLDSTQGVARMLGHPLPEWPRIPTPVAVTVFLVAFFYGAYSLHKETFEEARAKGKAEVLAEGTLKADILSPQTSAYVGKGMGRLIIFVYVVIRSSGSSAVRITAFRLVDELFQQYHSIPRTQFVEIDHGTVSIGPGTYFVPGEVVIAEPNRPIQVVAILATDNPSWERIDQNMCYTLTIEDDHRRTATVEFSCRVQGVKRG